MILLELVEKIKELKEEQRDIRTKKLKNRKIFALFVDYKEGFDLIDIGCCGKRNSILELYSVLTIS